MRNLLTVLYILVISLAVFGTPTSAQTAMPKAKQEVLFWVTEPSLYSFQHNYTLTSSSADASIQDNDFALSWQALGKEGSLSYGITARKNEITIAVDGNLDTSKNLNRAELAPIGNYISNVLQSPEIYIPYIEENPLVSVNVAFDMEANTSINLVPQFQNGNKLPNSENADLIARLWLLNSNNHFEFNPNSGSEIGKSTSSTSHSAFHHQITCNLGTYLSNNKHTDALNIMSRSDPFNGHNRVQVYRVPVFALLTAILDANKKELQSDPVQQSYDFSGAQPIGFSGNLGGKGISAKSTIEGKITLTISYPFLDTVNEDDRIKPLLNLDDIIFFSTILYFLPEKVSLAALGDLATDFSDDALVSNIEQSSASEDAKQQVREAVGHLERDLTPTVADGKISIDDAPDRAGHIFRPHHNLADTPENRQTIEDLVNDSQNFRMSDKYNRSWYTKKLPSGEQLWAWVQNRKIWNAGLNTVPWDLDQTVGLVPPK